MFSIAAIFVLRFSDQNTLSHSQTISLPGNPLHLAPMSDDGTLNAILVAVDTAESSTGTNGIVCYKWIGAAFSTTQDFAPRDASLSENEFDVTHEQVRKLLYSIGDLRKKGEDEQEGEGEEVEQAVQAYETS